MISQISLPFCPFFHTVHSPLCRTGIAHNARHILCSGPSFSLLGTSMDKRTDLYALSDIQKSHAFRPIDLMGAGTEHINIIIVHLDGKLSECLYCIGVEQNAMLSGNLPDFFNRLYRSDFIVGIHHRNQYGLRCNGLFQFFRPDKAIFIHVQISDVCFSHLLQIFTGVQNCMVFNLCGNDMISFIFIRFKSPHDCPVICLCSASGKIDLFRLCPQNTRDGLSGTGHRFLAGPCQFINTGGIPIVF